MNDSVIALLWVVGGVTLAAGLSACAKEAPLAAGSSPVPEFAVARSSGCLACHTTDGRPSMGPTWQALLGRPRSLTDGTTVIADEAYIRRSIVEPAAQVVAGSTTAMPKVDLTEEQVSALVAYIATV